MDKIELLNISKSYSGVAAVRNLSVRIREGEFLTLLGPSGCGKTTTLRMIAGLEDPDNGEIVVGGNSFYSADKGFYVPPEKRNLGFIFQSYALWPHMTVRKNISLGLEERKVDKERIEVTVKNALMKVQLDGLDARYPSELSGGQQQRVAVARMIAAEPQIFLMDEPLSNLDAMLRVDMRSELKHLHRELGATTVYVTHDQVEALTLSDRIVVMNEGRIMQCDTPERVYKKPANLFVAKFVGSPAINLLEGKISGHGDTLSFVSKDITIGLKGLSEFSGSYDHIIAAVRAEDITVSVVSDDTSDHSFRVYSVLPAGSETIVTVHRGDKELAVKLSGFTNLKVDDNLEIKIEPDKISFYDPDTEELLF